MQFGKRKDGQSYPKRKKSGTKRYGSIQSSGIRIQKQKKSHHVPFLEIENFEYSNYNTATGFIVIDGINWNVVANVFPVRDQIESDLLVDVYTEARKRIKKNPFISDCIPNIICNRKIIIKIF